MIRPEDIEQATQEAVVARMNIMNNIRRGLRLFAFSIVRLFLETWVVHEIWNRVVTDIVEVNTMTYWNTFLVMLMIRILMGQFKITMTTTRDTDNNIKK